MELNQYIEHTNLKLDTTMRDIETLCNEAIQYHFQAVCIQPYYVPLASSLLRERNVDIATVISYQNGLDMISTKSYAIIDAIQNGANEINFVLNSGAVKNKEYDEVREEIEELRDCADGKTIKVMLTDSYSEEELIQIIHICNETFVHFIEIPYQKKMIDTVLKHKGELLEIKVSGQLNEQEVESLVENGITRIGMNASGIWKKGGTI